MLGNKQVVDKRIAAELAAGQLPGPLPSQLASLVHTSPLGFVPKAHQPNKWCMICDLSSPYGGSINDGISPDLCSLHYAKLDAVNVIRHLGRGTQLVKLDLKDAYLIVPVHLTITCWVSNGGATPMLIEPYHLDYIRPLRSLMPLQISLHGF